MLILGRCLDESTIRKTGTVLGRTDTGAIDTSLGAKSERTDGTRNRIIDVKTGIAEGRGTEILENLETAGTFVIRGTGGMPGILVMAAGMSGGITGILGIEALCETRQDLEVRILESETWEVASLVRRTTGQIGRRGETDKRTSMAERMPDQFLTPADLTIASLSHPESGHQR